jgi:hypothetical protein
MAVRVSSCREKPGQLPRPAATTVAVWPLTVSRTRTVEPS